MSIIEIHPSGDKGQVPVTAKMPGAGGGGYLACVVADTEAFCIENQEAIRLAIRRLGM